MAGSFVEDPAFFMSGGCLRRPSAAPGYRLFPAESESGCGGCEGAREMRIFRKRNENVPEHFLCFGTFFE